MNFIEDVYDTRLGVMCQDAVVPGVENAFAPGSQCEREYSDMLDEDKDVEIIIQSFMTIQRELAFKMYEYGARLGYCKE